MQLKNEKGVAKVFRLGIGDNEKFGHIWDTHMQSRLHAHRITHILVCIGIVVADFWILHHYSRRFSRR